MMFCISSSLYILCITPAADIQTHQKVLLIQCLWQYNKKLHEKSLVSNKQCISAVRFCRKFHNMIYYINYSHVGFMLLSLKMQPHSKVDLRIYFGQDESLLIVINPVQYLFSCSILFTFGMLNFFYVT